jgi:hypothetical protein
MQRSIDALPVPPLDVDGPNRPLILCSACCGAARHSGHSCIVQHFHQAEVRNADKTDFPRVVGIFNQTC